MAAKHNFIKMVILTPAKPEASLRAINSIWCEGLAKIDCALTVRKLILNLQRLIPSRRPCANMRHHFGVVSLSFSEDGLHPRVLVWGAGATLGVSKEAEKARLLDRLSSLCFLVAGHWRTFLDEGFPRKLVGYSGRAACELSACYALVNATAHSERFTFLSATGLLIQ